eukprot:191878-Prymnesium_polylepis.1
MEKALVGTCEGDEVSATIPPEMGFDDPAKQFKHKPVPDGSTVVYTMRVVSIKKGYGAASLPRRSPPPPPPPGLLEILSENSSAIVFVLVLGALVMVLRAPPAGSSKGKRKPKKKG